MSENEIQTNGSSAGHEEGKAASPYLLKMKLLIAGIILLAAFFGSVFGFLAGSLAPRLGSRTDIPSVWQSLFRMNSTENDQRLMEINKETIVQEDSAIIDTVEKSMPTVVSITITKQVRNSGRSFSDPFGFFSFPGDSGGTTENRKVGGGSGFIVSDNGMIVTNKHVVNDRAASYKVMLSDGTEYDAKVLALDPVRDLAVIKIEASGLPVIPLGDSDKLRIGQTVLAIGNSLGEFSNTVSKGIISGLGRDLVAGTVFGEAEQLNGILQTDAPINPGNSGGPLINVNGEVIGVNVAMAEGAQNVGFAIPINQVKKAIDQVKEQGKIATPFLGVRYAMIDKEIQEANNLPFEYGAIVIRGERMADLAVIPGSPADKAGIVENDILLEVEGKRIDGKQPLSLLLSDFAAGDEIELKIWHRGETKTVRVRLEERK